ncbi:uncharacterized protein [Heterodontus francisci]|uniref:uncharacterized protein n=1 Tax=Heterodontus francisci TaxID=7792 RepID=UPI00355B0321
MESYEEFCKACLAQIKAKVNLEKSSLPATNCRGSLIRFHGIAILSPLLSPEQRKEIQKYQLKAMSYSETSKDKLHETQTSMQLLEVDKLLNSVQLIKMPAVKEILEDYSSLMLPNMRVNTGCVQEMNRGCVENSNTVHKTSLGHNESRIPEPTVAQMPNEIEEICNTNIMTDHVPVTMMSDLNIEKSGASNYQGDFSCFTLVASNRTRANNHIKNAPKSDDFQKTAFHALRNLTVHKIIETKHKATNSINKQENLHEIGSDGFIVISTGDKTNSSNSECLNHPTNETDVGQNSPPDTPAVSLQSLLNKSRECRDRQRQPKLLKALQCKVPGRNIADEENDLDATKDRKNSRWKRNDSGKTKLPNTMFNPDPVLPSVFSLCSHTLSEHNQTSIASNVNTEKTNKVLHKCQMLSKERKGTKIDDVDPKTIFTSSKPLKVINRHYCSKRNPVHPNAGGQVSQCQEGSDNVNGSAKSQKRSFIVPQLALSKSPVFSKKWTCPSQKLLVNAPISVGGEKIDQQVKERTCNPSGQQSKISIEHKHNILLNWR